MVVKSPRAGPHNDAIAAEAERLRELIVSNAEPLRTARLGKEFQVDGASFRLFGKARNAIYRVKWDFNWFLKLTSSGDSRAMVRERLGATMVGEALASCAEYDGAALTQVGLDPAYVLATTIPGRPLNLVFLTRSWLPDWAGSQPLHDQFGRLGRLLATLHADSRPSSDTPEATSRPFETLEGLLGAVSESDGMTDTIAAWYESHVRPDGGSSFVHGNFRLDNIQSADARLGFLDFENCGTGSSYQDLSRPVAELLLTRSLVAFPQQRVTRCIRAFLDGYAQVRPHDEDILWDFVGARVARYYLETRERGSFPGRIGGIPVVRKKIDDLTRVTLTGNLRDLIPQAGQ